MAGLGCSASTVSNEKGTNHGCSGTDNSEMLKLQSAEGDIFEVELGAACMSKLIKNMMEDCDIDEVIPLCNVNTAVLAKIIDYCNHHKGKEPGLVQKPLKSTNLIACGISAWDCEYVNIEQDMIFELAKAANYLDMPSLLDLSCAKVASMVKGRSTQEILEQFNINNLKPEEEAIISGSPEAQVGDVSPKLPATCRVSLDETISKSELAIDIPDGFKTIEIPAAYRNFLKSLASLAAKCSAQALDALSKRDPRMALKVSYGNFQEADEDGHGVLNSEHFLRFGRMEHRDFCDIVGLELPFDEGLYAEGFACQQFEGRGGVTFTDLQIGSHMACRILREGMAS